MEVKIETRTEETVKYIPTATINKDEVRNIITAYFEGSELAEKYRLISMSFVIKPLRVSDEWGMNNYQTYTFEGVTFEMEEKEKDICQTCESDEGLCQVCYERKNTVPNTYRV